MKNRQAGYMRFKEGPCRLAGMIACSILNQNDVLCRLIENLVQEVLVAFRIEASLCQTLIEETSREEINRAKDLVPLALSAGSSRPVADQQVPRCNSANPIGQS